MFNTAHGPLSYQQKGSGQPLLLLAGGPGLNASYLHSMADELSKHHQVILLNQRGTDPELADSFNPEHVKLSVYLEDIEALRKHLGIDVWSVLGHSWGGMLASAFVAEFGDVVDRLVLFNTAGLHFAIFGQLFDNLMARLSGEEYAQAVELAGRLQTPGGAAFATQFFRVATPAYFYDKTMAAEFANNIDESFLSFPVYGLMMQDVVANQLNLCEAARDFTKPVLSIHGRQDMVGAQVYLDIQTYYPQVQVAWLEQAGHYGWLEQPDAYYQTVNAFLNS